MKDDMESFVACAGSPQLALQGFAAVELDVAVSGLACDNWLVAGRRA
ncbi:MAG TPA: hypothetical protein GX529_00210 [Firmicutes bacterium]|nr:hypothetical protein [Candidatus Fermentithermobacillaceae bacterium]